MGTMAADDIWVGDKLYVDIRDGGVELEQLIVVGVQSMFSDMSFERAKAIAESFISDLVAERHEAHLTWTATTLLAQDRALFEMSPENKVSLGDVSRYLTGRLRNESSSTCPAMSLAETSCAEKLNEC